MYISSKFKCQLSFNWHLNLIEGCATQPCRCEIKKELCACINILNSIYLSSSNSFILLPKKRWKKYNEIKTRIKNKL